TLGRPWPDTAPEANTVRVDEVVVHQAAAHRYHLHVGQRVTIVTDTDQNAFYGTAPMGTGPSVPARIVGIGDSMMDLIFNGTDPGLMPSAGLLRTYGKVVQNQGNLLVRLRPGPDVP